MPHTHAACIAVCLLAGSAFAIDCSGTSTGFPPLSDVSASPYLGQFDLGLYPDWSNVPPPVHDQAGLSAAAAVVPLDAQGLPDADGFYVLMSVGMSNTTQEFCSQNGREPCDSWTFMGQAAVHADVNDTQLWIVNGARGGQAIGTWDNPGDANWFRVRDDVLAPRGLGEAQVQALWIKQANPQPTLSLPDVNADAFRMVGGLADVVRSARAHYPNLRQVFLSSRIYAGYADSPLNPEPYAYESGFAIKWLIEAQINQQATGVIDPDAGDLSPAVAPWLGWGPYLWADGLTPRPGDGLTWACDEFQNDGTHPGQPAEEKVGAALLEFFLTSPYTQPWFGTGEPDSCDPADLAAPFGVLDLADVGAFVAGFTSRDPIADLAPPIGVFDLADVGAFTTAFVAGCP